MCESTGVLLARRSTARKIGVIYFLYFFTAVCAVLFAKGLVVSGDGVATVASLSKHETAFRAGFAIGLLGNLLYVVLTALFYDFFRPVNRSLSLLAAFLSLVGCAVQTLGSVFQLAPLVVLDATAPSLTTFNGAESQALVTVFLRLHVQAFSVGLVFFACYDLLLGYLIYRSGFLPRFLGVFMALAGLGWLCYLWPPLASSWSRYVQPLGFLAEFTLMLWLIVMGVRRSTA